MSAKKATKTLRNKDNVQEQTDLLLNAGFQVKEVIKTDEEVLYIALTVCGRLIVAVQTYSPSKITHTRCDSINLESLSEKEKCKHIFTFVDKFMVEWLPEKSQTCTYSGEHSAGLCGSFLAYPLEACLSDGSKVAKESDEWYLAGTDETYQRIRKKYQKLQSLAEVISSPSVSNVDNIQRLTSIVNECKLVQKTRENSEMLNKLHRDTQMLLEETSGKIDEIMNALRKILNGA